jgi:hypothetical protein
MAGNLGFRAYAAEKASFTFGNKYLRGVMRSADDTRVMSLVNLHLLRSR